MPVLVGLGGSGILIEKDKKSGFYSWMNTLMTWETFKHRQVSTKQWFLTDILLGPPLMGG